MTNRFLSPLLFAGLFSILPIATHAQPLPKIKLQPIFKSRNFDRPIWMSQAPGDADRFYVIEETGRILILQKGSDGSDAKEFMNIKARSPFIENGQNTAIGLLGLAFHPGFATNRLFYALYSQPNTNKAISFPNRTIISEFRTSSSNPDEADLSSERILFDIPEPFKNNIGGQMSFGPDGFLYISLGDGGSNNDPYGSGQNPGSLLSKILRIDVNSRTITGSGKDKKELPYAIPSDNPWVNEIDMGNSGARKEMYAWGLRNVWRFSWDRKTGYLWGADVGERLWEEVDLIVKGGNYGWNAREGAHHFKPAAPGAQFIDPVIEYPHSPKLLSQSQFPKHGVGVCVIGGYVYRGSKYPSLDGVYLYADFSLGTIFGFRYDEGKVTDYGTLLEQPKNIVSFAEDADGELYVLSLIEHNDGHIFAIEAE